MPLLRKHIKRCSEDGAKSTVGEEKTNIVNSRIMARRPRPPDEALSRKELAELQHRLSMMSVTAVQDFYQSAHMVCRIGPGHFPSARAIQELVQAWKQMRRWR
jgi:hypothetical protein